LKLKKNQRTGLTLNLTGFEKRMTNLKRKNKKTLILLIVAGWVKGRPDIA